MPKEYKADKHLLTNEQKKLTEIFGDVVIEKTHRGYIARFEKYVYMPMKEDEDSVCNKLSSAQYIETAAIESLFTFTEQHAKSGREFLIGLKPFNGGMYDTTKANLRKAGYKGITLPRPK